MWELHVAARGTAAGHEFFHQFADTRGVGSLDGLWSGNIFFAFLSRLEEVVEEGDAEGEGVGGGYGDEARVEGCGEDGPEEWVEALVSEWC